LSTTLSDNLLLAVPLLMATCFGNLLRASQTCGLMAMLFGGLLEVIQFHLLHARLGSGGDAVPFRNPRRASAGTEGPAIWSI
jgi:hypothetical protein